MATKAASAPVPKLPAGRALPDHSRGVVPFFERFVTEPFQLEDATIRVFVGELAGHGAQVTEFTPLVGAQLNLPAGGSVTLPVDARFEHGLIVDVGEPRFEGVTIPVDHLGVVPTGRDRLRIDAGDQPLRALLIGGEPLGEQIIMWWNFVGRSHEEIVAYREQWQHEVIAGEDPDGRFGTVDGYDGSPLAAPELPNVRLRPRC